ncbi:uncharacterized protein PAC_09648 [Phialocephala subalpina]|uniref:Uncharacterized protein n=1 Tax=Phialocephala subalpina TaxID=576137 RepID=A0A1L7X403_9HELO|nr:uncharacterized protein PAC_09648 [Phialocephala subalpina]
MADKRYKDKTTSQMPETRRQKAEAEAAAKALVEERRRANQQSQPLESALKKAKSTNSLRERGLRNGKQLILGQRVSMDGLATRYRVEGVGHQGGNSDESTPKKDDKPWNEMEYILSCAQANIRENPYPEYFDGTHVNLKQIHRLGELSITQEQREKEAMDIVNGLDFTKIELPDWMFNGDLGKAALLTSMFEETVTDIETNFLDEVEVFKRYGGDVGNMPDQLLVEIEEKKIELDRKVQFSKEVLGFGANHGGELGDDVLEQVGESGLDGMAEVPAEAPESASEVGSGQEKGSGHEDQMKGLGLEDAVDLATKITEPASEVNDSHKMDPNDVYDIPPPHPGAKIRDTPLQGVPLPIATNEYEEKLVRQYKLDLGLGTSFEDDPFPELAKHNARPDPDFLGDGLDYLEAVEPELQEQPFDYSGSRIPDISNAEFSTLMDDMYATPKPQAPKKKKKKKAPAAPPVTPKKFYDQSPLKPHSSLPKRPEKVMVPSKYTPRPGDGSPPAKRSAVSQGHSISSSSQGKDSSTGTPTVQPEQAPTQQQRNNGSPKPKRGRSGRGSQGNSRSFSGQGLSSLSGGQTQDSRPHHQQQRRGGGLSHIQGGTGYSRSFSGQPSTSPMRSMVAPNQQVQHRSGSHPNYSTFNPAARAFSGRVMADSAAPQFGQPPQHQQGNGYGARSPTQGSVPTFSQAPAPARVMQEVVRLPFPEQEKRARAIQTMQRLFRGLSSGLGYTVAEEGENVVVRGPLGGNLRGLVMSAFPLQRKVQIGVE